MPTMRQITSENKAENFGARDIRNPDVIREQRRSDSKSDTTEFVSIHHPQIEIGNKVQNSFVVFLKVITSIRKNVVEKDEVILELLLRDGKAFIMIAKSI